MSRFDSGRWNRILVWTGAALAWGTAVIAARLEPARATDAEQPLPEVNQQATSTTLAAMPASPSEGLVILRFTPVPAPEPEIRTVYVERSVPARSSGGGSSASSGGSSGSGRSAPPPASPAPAQPAPAPSSSGS